MDFREADAGDAVEALRGIGGQFGGIGFVVHVHEKVHFVDARCGPFFQFACPGVDPAEVGFVEAVAYEADEGFGDGEFGVQYIASSGRVRYDGAHAEAGEFVVVGLLELFVGVKRGVPLFDEPLDV